MTFPLVTGGESRELQKAPTGNHVSRCYQVVDLGQQKTTFQGTEKIQRQLLLGFELCDELMEDGRPFAVSNTYSFSLGPKANLRRVLEGWRGRPFSEQELSGFDVSVLAGKPCMVQIAHRQANNGKTYVNIQSIGTLPKGLQAPEPQNQVVVYSPYAHDAQAYDKLPDWVKRRLSDRVKEEMPDERGRSPELDDDIPFN